MKTTIEISDPLLKQTKRYMAEKGLTLRSVVEESLRIFLGTNKKKAPHTFKFRNASVRGKGLAAGIKEGDWDTIKSLAYEGRGG
ncbi:hypothetical protein K1X76_01550 [bacterium]|nr:hypothetical protein [bacterium]